MNAYPEIEIKEAELWPTLLTNTSTSGILHSAMRHVAHNLSDMLGRPIKIDTISLETVPIDYLEACCNDPEAETVGIYLLMDGDLSGEAILILCPEDAMYLADWLLETRPGTTTRLADMERSALAELGNQALSSFLNAIADLTGAPLRLSPPAVVVDMLAVIFEAVAMSADTADDQLSIIKTTFTNTESSVGINFWVLPDFATSANPIA
jgi:chemotaxis protein CheY-P-specific phosphatase CheC